MSWLYSLRASLRGLVRELVRGVWARWFIYPGLAANERDGAVLRQAVARRAQQLGLALGPGGTLDPATPLIDKAAVRAAPHRYIRPRVPDVPLALAQSMTMSPGITLLTPVPALMLDICQEVGR